MTRFNALFALLCLACSPLAALAGQTSLLTPNSFTLGVASGADATLDASGDVLHITIKKPADPYYGIAVGQVIASAVPADHLIHLAFRARSSTANPMRAVAELASPPYTSATQAMLTLEKDWHTTDLSFTSTGYPAGGLALRFQCGQQIGDVELTDIRLDDMGPDPELIAARSAIEPAAVAARIDGIRKRELQLTITDAAGRAISGATLSIHQTRHAFLFGANIFGLDLKDDSPLQLAYQQRFAALLNYATLGFYWSAFEPKPGQTNDKKLMAIADWCAQHHIVTKGHPLVWHQTYPDWAPRDAAAAQVRLQARVTDLVSRYRGKVNRWDVVNEANGSPWEQNNGVGDWARRDGPAAMVGTALQWARSAGKGSDETFIYNDYDTTSSNVALLRSLQEKNQLPDVIGIQSHMHDRTWRPEDIWETSQRFSVFGRPLHFTEVTVVSGENRKYSWPNPSSQPDWPSTAEGEAAQADYLARFYSILFSHPAVQAITYWDLSDYHAWLSAPAGLLRKDMTPKPAYDRLMDLIHRQWWTTADITADAHGLASLRAFCGEYEITATDAGGHQKVVHLNLPLGDEPLKEKIQVDAK